MYRTPSQKGFTLVELLVSVALFLVVMMVSVGTLLSLADANRKAQTIKTVMDNLNFAMDSMARNLRTGTDYGCGAGGDCPGGGTLVTFVSDEGCSVAYSFVAPVAATPGKIQRRITGGDPGCPNDPAAVDLTAVSVNVTAMRFWVSGSAPKSAPGSDTEQPSVTIAIRGITNIDPNLDTSFNVQTTVTQRLLDL